MFYLKKRGGGQKSSDPQKGGVKQVLTTQIQTNKIRATREKPTNFQMHSITRKSAFLTLSKYVTM